MNVFDFRRGWQDLRASRTPLRIYLVVVAGILLHWVYDVLIAALDTGSIEFGTWVVVVARLGIAFIAAAFSFTGIWTQLQKVDPSIRYFTALTLGFAVDALTGPPVGLLGA